MSRGASNHHGSDRKTNRHAGLVDAGGHCSQIGTGWIRCDKENKIDDTSHMQYELKLKNL
jgi:hypothetical protein